MDALKLSLPVLTHKLLKLLPIGVSSADRGHHRVFLAYILRKATAAILLGMASLRSTRVLRHRISTIDGAYGHGYYAALCTGGSSHTTVSYRLLLDADRTATNLA